LTNLLLENSLGGEFRREAGNVASVLGGEILLRGANFLAVVVLGRLYGPTTLGLYATTLAFATVAVMLGECGLQLSTITEIGRAPKQVNRVFGRIYSLRIALFLVLLLVLAAIGWVRRWSPHYCMVSGLVTVRTMLYSCSQLQFAVLKSLDRMKLIGLIQIVSFALLCVGTGLAYSLSWGFVTLLSFLVVVQSVEITLTLVLLGSRGIWPRPFFPSEFWLLLKSSTAVGLTYLIAGVILRADVIVLTAINSSADVGRFAAANVGIVFAYAVSWLLGSVLLADQVRLRQFPSEALSYIRRWRKILLLATVPSSLLLCGLAPVLVRLLYGRGFESAGSPASVMVLAVPFIVLNAAYLSRAIALDAKQVYLGIYLGTAVIAVCLDVALGRLYGAVGVATAIVIREALMLTAFVVFDSRLTPASRSFEGSVICSPQVGTIAD